MGVVASSWQSCRPGGPGQHFHVQGTRPGRAEKAGVGGWGFCSAPRRRLPGSGKGILVVGARRRLPEPLRCALCPRLLLSISPTEPSAALQ